MSVPTCSCGAECGFVYDLYKKDGRVNPLCTGEVNLIDEVDMGEEWGWESLHYCEYHAKQYQWDRTLLLYPKDWDD